MSIYSSEVLIDNPVTVAGGIIDASGSNVSVTNFPATQPVSGTVNIGNTVSVITAVASSALLTQVILPASTSTQLLAANANRKSAIIFSPKSSEFIAYDASCSATHFTYQTGAANTTIIVSGYTGPISAFGPAQTYTITELV